MPAKDIRTAVVSQAKNKTAGKRIVTYVDTKGKSVDATVLGAGTSSGLKLNINNLGGAIAVKDNVAALTAAGQTNRYISR